MTNELHCHTYYSDGKYSPTTVIDYAIQTRLRYLAITDHDNMRGSREAAAYLKMLDHMQELTLIPAVEITTHWPEAGLPAVDVNVDVLAYFVNPEDAAFLEFETSALNDIYQRISLACERLTAQGYPLSMQDVWQENPRYAGAMPAIEAAVRKKLFPGWDEAVKHFNAAWYAGPPPKHTIQETIAAIHHAGGVAVLAHPVIVRPEGQRMTARWLATLAEAGLDGIEVYHHRHDTVASEHFLSLARECNLLITSGTDMHGWKNGIEEMGKYAATDEMVAALKDKSGKT